MADEIGGMLLNDLSPQIAAIGNVPKSYQQGQLDALSLQNAQMENQKGQIGLDEMQKTSPDRVAKSYFDTVQNINTPQGTALGGGEAPQKFMGYDIQDMHEEMNKRFPTPADQKKFLSMPPEEQAKVMQDVKKTVSNGMTQDDFTPIGESTGVIGLDKDGNLVHHQTGATIDMDNPASKKALYNRAANLGVESDSAVQQREAEAKADAAQQRIETSVEGKKDVAKIKAEEDLKKAGMPARGRAGGTDQAKVDRESEMTIKALMKPNAFGSVSAENKARAQQLIGSIQTPAIKSRAQIAYGTMLMNGGPQVPPVASNPSPQPEMVRVREVSSGRTGMMPRNKIGAGYEVIR